MPPELERIWNAMQPKLDIIDEELEAIAHYQARNGMRRKVKRTLLLVACALLVCGCALATGIKLWDLKVGVIDGTLAISVQRNQNESTLQREAGTGWGDALDQALVEHDIRAAVPKWIPEGFELAAPPCQSGFPKGLSWQTSPWMMRTRSWILVRGMKTARM